MAFYLIDKEQGITSNKALSFLKRELNIKKAGFSGVLDPFATGLLIVATEGDTKFLDLFLNSPKTYTGKILFGRRTDSLDIDGETIEESNDFNLDFDKLKEVIENKFIGKINQVPPKYSNIKVDGKRAHELSRKNVDFELKSVEREVYSFEIDEPINNEVSFKVNVSSGTYIRSLARDIGDELNIPTMLSSLRRESIGKINVPNETIESNREDIVPLKFESIDSKDINNLLNGKVVKLSFDEEDLIVKDDSRYIWIKQKENNKYKIHKNIQ